MLFKSGTVLYAYEVVREAESQVMYVNYLGASSVPNIAEYPEIMARTVDLLISAPNISRIVFVQQRNYSYSSEDVFMLQEIADLYVYLTKQENVLSPLKLSIMNSSYVSQRHNDMSYLLMTLKRDALACYFELKRLIKQERNKLDGISESLKTDQISYVRL